MNKCFGFQLVSKNHDGQIVACFTEPCVEITWPAYIQDLMGGYDPQGYLLEIIIVEMP